MIPRLSTSSPTMRVPLNDLQRVHAANAGPLEAALRRVLASGRYILGEQVEGFEAEFAAYCGARFCTGVANGSDALELALTALGIVPGDRVVTVANAAMYATLAILRAGARPLYADVDPGTLTMAVDSLRECLRQGPRAIVVTHLYGRLAGMEEIGALARDAGIPVVEDCAQAHGAARSGRKGGSFGAIGTYSFYPTKNLGALGDGGALVTSDEQLAEKLRALRQYGWTRKYEVSLSGGRNSRLDEMQAAVLRHKLPLLDAANARRRQIAARYSAAISHPEIRVPDAAGEGYVAHLYVVRSALRASLRAWLAERQIGTDIHYPIPDHRQPVFTDDAPPVLPETERACREVLTLPCFPELEEAEVQSVIDACNAWRP
jgi:dTDP-4-amino-4,6-dideoxygalactose transaminase